MAGVQGDLSMPPVPPGMDMSPLPPPRTPTPPAAPAGAAATAPAPPQPNYAAGDALIAGMGDPLSQTNALMTRQRIALAPAERAVQQAGREYQQAAAGAPKPPQQPSPEPQQGMGLEAAGSWVMVATALGAIAGAMTRRSATNALAAFTGALEGVQQGNKQAFEQNKTIWEQENKRINQQLQQQRDSYLDILNSKKLNFDMKMLELQQEAARQHDDTMAQQAARRDMITIAGMVDKREELRVRGVEDYQKMDNALKVAEIRAGGQQRQIGDEAAQRAADQLDQGQPESQVLARMNRADAAYVRSLQKASPEQIGQKKQEFAGDMAGARSLGPRIANLEAVNNQLVALVPQAIAASKAVGRVGIMSVDEAIQWAQTQAGNPPLKYFVMTNIQLSEQWARALKGPGVLDKGLQDLTFRNLTTAQNDGSYATAVKAIVDGVARERTGLQQQRTRTPQQTPDVPGAYTPPGATGAGASPQGEGWQELAPGIRFREIK